MADVTERSEFGRLRLTRNSDTLYDQVFATEATTYTRQSTDRLVLATNMVATQEINIGDLNSTNPGKVFMMETDNKIKVSVDVTTSLWPVDQAVLFVGTFSHVFVQNQSTTNEAIVTFGAAG